MSIVISCGLITLTSPFSAVGTRVASTGCQFPAGSSSIKGSFVPSTSHVVTAIAP